MTIKQFIEKAMKGGWIPFREGIEVTSISGMTTAECIAKVYPEKAFLDPLAWQAVGKVEGWGLENCLNCGGRTEKDCTCENGTVCPPIEESIYNMHLMIDALAEGKTVEEFLGTL